MQSTTWLIPNTGSWSVGNRKSQKQGDLKFWMVLKVYIYCYLKKPYFEAKVENFKVYPKEIWTGFATLFINPLHQAIKEHLHDCTKYEDVFYIFVYS